MPSRPIASAAGVPSSGFSSPGAGASTRLEGARTGSSLLSSGVFKSSGIAGSFAAGPGRPTPLAKRVQALGGSPSNSCLRTYGMTVLPSELAPSSVQISALGAPSTVAAFQSKGNLPVVFRPGQAFSPVGGSPWQSTSVVAMQPGLAERSQNHLAHGVPSLDTAAPFRLPGVAEPSCANCRETVSAKMQCENIIDKRFFRFAFHLDSRHRQKKCEFPVWLRFGSRKAEPFPLHRLGLHNPARCPARISRKERKSTDVVPLS